MEEKVCRACRHFRQHYVRFGRSYREAHCGHCVYPRVKSRAPDTKACGAFEEKKTEKMRVGPEGQ